MDEERMQTQLADEDKFVYNITSGLHTWGQQVNNGEGDQPLIQD